MNGDEKVKPWQWPGEWVRQESFWREVGTRTLAAIFAAGVIYLFALLGGYVARPDNRAFIISAGTLIVAVLYNIWAWRRGKLLR